MASSIHCCATVISAAAASPAQRKNAPRASAPRSPSFRITYATPMLLALNVTVPMVAIHDRVTGSTPCCCSRPTSITPMELPIMGRVRSSARRSSACGVAPCTYVISPETVISMSRPAKLGRQRTSQTARTRLIQLPSVRISNRRRRPGRTVCMQTRIIHVDTYVANAMQFPCQIQSAKRRLEVTAAVRAMHSRCMSHGQRGICPMALKEGHACLEVTALNICPRERTVFRRISAVMPPIRLIPRMDRA